MLRHFVSTATLLLSLVTLATGSGDQTSQPEWLQNTPPEFRNQFMPRHEAPGRVQPVAGLQSPSAWASLVDVAWGPGLLYGEHTAIWMTLWSDIDQRYACFHDLEVGIWDSVWNRYWPEIQDTVSRGRLCAITQHSRRLLHESHTACYDSVVAFTRPEPGVPLMFYGGWGLDDYFGAGLTPLADRSLLVYKVVDNHPLGLEPGDLVLGYDGRPWHELYPELLEAELPFGQSWWWGSSETSFDHSFMMAAGKNWHLFDSIDVVKYSSGDTTSLATSIMVGQDVSLWTSEQVAVPGVSMPEMIWDGFGSQVPDSPQMTSWGIIEGTSIGYLYTLGWFPVADSARIVREWFNALDSMQNVHNVTGLIIDIRACYGAMFDHSVVLEYFYDTTFECFQWDGRCTVNNHLSMCPFVGSVDLPDTVHGDPATYWDKPIAVLTGPGALSGGDFFALEMSYHPMTKFFGKPTAGTYSVVSWTYPLTDWFHATTVLSARLSGETAYLTRSQFPDTDEFPWDSYQHIWLTRDGVAEGRDDVVEAAVDWIVSLDTDQDGVFNQDDNCPNTYNPGQDFGACCCAGFRGNVDFDPGNIVDIGDLTALISFLYIPPNPQPICMVEANVDGDLAGLVDIGDLTALIAYLYIPPNPEPAICP
jgi:hypothetical protein